MFHLSTSSAFRLVAASFLLFSLQLHAEKLSNIKSPALKNSIEKPPLQLASVYQQPADIAQYWVSEKLDGVRGYWDGQKLFTRNGNALPVPNWFSKNWPNTAMDGELWSARGEFEKISACVRTTKSDGSCWRALKLMVFDLPQLPLPFSQRVPLMQEIITTTNSPYLNMIKQQKVGSIERLHALLNNVVENNGEGLMLHLATASYHNGRTKNVLKLKKYQDAEAIVIAHTPGKGKFQRLLGAIKVRTPEGIEFKIGSGFSNQERQHPPKIGSIITYKYIGKTRRGVPRFASFLRIKTAH